MQQREREERQTMKMKLYHTEVFNKTLSDVYQAGDNTAEVKRLLSRLALHYLENTVTPRERQIQINLLFIDVGSSLADDKERQAICREILKSILLGILIPK